MINFSEKTTSHEIKLVYLLRSFKILQQQILKYWYSKWSTKQRAQTKVMHALALQRYSLCMPDSFVCCWLTGPHATWKQYLNVAGIKFSSFSDFCLKSTFKSN